jgi:hypothetical protein
MMYPYLLIFFITLFFGIIFNHDNIDKVRIININKKTTYNVRLIHFGPKIIILLFRYF